MAGRNLLIVKDKPQSYFAEAYRAFRTNLQYSKVDRQLKSILFTSSGPGEGKSVTAANTAIALAQAGEKVILIDCDFRRPVQHLLFGRIATGVTNVLAGQGTVLEYLQKTDVPNLRFLASGALPPNPADLLGSKRMAELLVTLKDQADYLIVDSTPVLPVTDACILASRVDGVILVLRAGVVRLEEAQKAREALEQVKGVLLGVIVNRVSEKSDKYYRYYADKRYRVGDKHETTVSYRDISISR